MKVLLIGATGATGEDLLELLLQDNAIESVDIFVRRDVNIQHEKLNTHIINFDQPETWWHLVKGDVLYSCLGTTLKAAGSKEAQKKVDYLYQLQFAKAARENNVHTFVLVSSAYVSSKSPFFYPRIKGQLEDDVKALNFPKIIIYNPPGLIRKNSDRKSEVIGIKIFQFFNLIGLFKSAKPIETHILAKSMLNATTKLSDGEHAVKGEEIWEMASEIEER